MFINETFDTNNIFVLISHHSQFFFTLKVKKKKKSKDKLFKNFDPFLKI